MNTVEKKSDYVEERIVLKMEEKTGNVEEKIEKKMQEKKLTDGLTRSKQISYHNPLEEKPLMYFKTLPHTERLNVNTLYNVLDLRFGQKYFKDNERLQMKTRHQKTGESLQEFSPK
ncbi:hypothetical protein TNCV_4015311 [Trichonephila clavipes]|nr:hypothetical protein TNCV_4015311 [Trichonephila clavipes]